MTRSALTGICAFSVAYLLAGPLHLPVLVYDPVGRAVAASSSPAGMQMRYFGDLLLAIASGLAAAGLMHRLRPRLPLAVSAWTALGLVALDAFYFVWRLFAAA